MNLINYVCTLFILASAKIQLSVNAFAIGAHNTRSYVYLKMSASTPTVEPDRENHIHRYDSPFFPDEPGNAQVPSALIILNTPITSSSSSTCDLSGALEILWQKSTYRICADGGANRLFEASVIGASDDDTISANKYIPDLITGDLDSLLPNVREYYEKRGVPIVRVEDQDYHDLDVSATIVCAATFAGTPLLTLKSYQEIAHGSREVDR